jgi:hypothetical protein
MMCRDGLFFEPECFIEVVVSKPKPKPSITTLLEMFFNSGLEECARCEQVAYSETNRFYILPK